MRAMTQGTALVALGVIDHINGAESDEEALGALNLLIDFLIDVREQRSQSYWEHMDWRRVDIEGAS